MLYGKNRFFLSACGVQLGNGVTSPCSIANKRTKDINVPHPQEVLIRVV